MLILLLSPPITSEQLLGVLLVYRAIYYLLPLMTGLALLGWYEIRKLPRWNRLV